MAKKVVSTIEQFATELPQDKNTSSFVLRMRRIFPTDEDLLAFLNRPYMGRQDKTLWQRLTSGKEPALRGLLWDATSALPVLREVQATEAELKAFLSQPLSDLYLEFRPVQLGVLYDCGIKTVGDLHKASRGRVHEIFRGPGRLCGSDARRDEDRIVRFFAEHPLAGPWPRSE